MTYDSKGVEGVSILLDNPLFLPLTFLSEENNVNSPGKVLQLKDVLNDEMWQKKLAPAKISIVPNLSPGQIVVEITGGILFALEKPFVYHIYFNNESDSPQFLPVKINLIVSGRTFKSFEFEYEPMDLDGKQMYWVRSAHMLSTWPIHGKETIVYERTIKTEFLEINKELSSDIFTLDISSAKSIWDNNLKKFIKQKGEFTP